MLSAAARHARCCQRQLAAATAATCSCAAPLTTALLLSQQCLTNQQLPWACIRALHPSAWLLHAQQQHSAAAPAATAAPQLSAGSGSGGSGGSRSAALHTTTPLAQQPPPTLQPQQQRGRARMLDGKGVAAAWSAELQAQVADLSRVLHRRPGLAVVLVGSRADSLVYVSRKQEACRAIGVHCRVLRLPDTVQQADLQAVVAEVSADRAIDGVLVQLPLPPHLNEEAVMEALDPRKDVDGFHPLNMGRMLMRGPRPRFVPATPLGVVELLSRSGIDLAGRTAVVLGDSNIVGGPIAALLRDAGVALVTVCHRVGLQDLLEQQRAARHDAQRAPADACLPRLFGPAPPAAAVDSAATQQAAAPPSRAPAARGAAGRAAASRFQPSQLPAICRTADILVVAVGSAALVRGSWVKPGAVVVDVGINVVPLDGVPPQQQSQQQQQQPQQQQSQEQPQQQQPPGPAGERAAASDSRAGGGGRGAGAAVRARPQVQLQLVVREGEDGSISLGSDYRVVGDVHEEVARVASAVTPVPGGVGPMTIAAVLHNTLQAARYTAGLLQW